METTTCKTVLNQIKANPKTNVFGSLGSRNAVPASVSVNCRLGNIWCITSRQAIYNNNGFNYSIDIDLLDLATLTEINTQLNN